jgi:hypothetical protein
MNVGNALLWGFAATVVLTTLMSASRSLRLTRMDIPFLLGTMFTADRHKAKWIGFVVHILIGWGFALIYAAAFESARLSTWWFGGLIGFVHASFVLTVGMSVAASIHPRMASEESGPDPTRMLEPPGFLILNYGRGTPIATMVAHLVYGGVLGYFYRPAI